MQCSYAKATVPQDSLIKRPKEVVIEVKHTTQSTQSNSAGKHNKN